MKLHKSLLLLIGASALLLTACGDDGNVESAEQVSEVTYEQKDITSDDVAIIEYGDDLDTVYETLGIPLTEWTSDFVYDSLDDAISRNELVLLLAKDSNQEFSKAIEDEIETINEVKEIENLKMLQYTYTYEEDTEETALFWIDPKTNKVVAIDKRGYIDENGNPLEEEVEVEETEEKSSVGSRSNPTPFGSALALSGTFKDYDAGYDEFDASVEVVVTDTIRGDEAWNMIVNENQFNDPAPEGQEYIINRIQLKLYDASNEDSKLGFRYSDFDYISNSGASYKSPSVVLPDKLSIELYNNGIGEGNVVGLIDIDDEPLLRFEDSFFFETK